MIPILDKNAVRVITQNIAPEQVQYVADVNSVLQDVKQNYPAIEENNQCDDVLFLTKIIAFADKFKNLHWAAKNMQYHEAIDHFWQELELYKDSIAENIQAILGQFYGDQFTKITLPTGDNPLDIINDLKICLNNWIQLHADNIEYEGCRNATSGFLEIVHKYIYIFRLCKISCD